MFVTQQPEKPALDPKIGFQQIRLKLVSRKSRTSSISHYIPLEKKITFKENEET